jgi:surface protein
MSRVFYNASSFNQNLSGWDVSNVTNMSFMFNGATSFNQDISSWDVSNVTSMSHMFCGAKSFNSDISDWNVSKVTNMSNMFYGVTLSTDNYDSLLISWSQQDVKPNVKFHGGNSKYSSVAVNSRQILVNKGWTITDGGLIPTFVSNWSIQEDDLSLILPITDQTEDFVVDWGDETINSTLSHEYQEEGTYKVKVYGKGEFGFGPYNFNHASKLVSIEYWGDIKVKNGGHQFYNCSNLVDVGDIDISHVTNMDSMFSGATSFNQDISGWNVSNVTNMYNMFRSATLSTANYDKLLIGWSKQDLKPNVNFHGGNSKYSSASENARQILADKGWTINDGGLIPTFVSTWSIPSDDKTLALPITAYYQGNVEVDWGDESEPSNSLSHEYEEEGTYKVKVYGSGMFGFSTEDFNHGSKLVSIEYWGDIKVKNGGHQFYNCSNLVDVSDIDISHVTNMSLMFYNASNFNQNLSGWDTSKVTGMSNMFNGATSFNQDLSAWDVSNVTDMSYMFQGATLSTANYDKLLLSWSKQEVKSDVDFHGGYSQYSNAVLGARQVLINKGWWITDGGLVPTFVSTWNIPSNDKTLALPIIDQTEDFVVDWGDETINSTLSHEYEEEGVYEVRVTGDSLFGFASDNTTHSSKLVSIEGWGNIKVRDGGYQFYNCSNLVGVGEVDVSNVTDMSYMFQGATLSTANYDKLLLSWSKQEVKSRVKFHAGNSKYSSASENARQTLENKGWTITDGGVLSSDATLSNLVPSTGDLSPAFSPTETKYSVTVPYATTSLIVTGKKFDANATMDPPDGNLLFMNLSMGSNEKTITVTSEDRSVIKDYKVNVLRQSADATLSNLVPSEGILSPAFNESTMSYTVIVPNNVTSLIVIGMANATMDPADGKLEFTGLSVGWNEQTIKVTLLGNNAKNEYKVKVYRQSNNANLESLTAVDENDENFPFSFDADIFDYTITVPNSIENLTVTGTKSDDNATMEPFDGSLLFENLSVGTSGEQTITVTSEDGKTTQEYTVKVYRQSNDATLSDLTTDEGSLSPVFSPTTTSYMVTVPYETTSLTITGVTADSNASMEPESGEVTVSDLEVEEEQTETITVTAEDGTEKTYTITIKKLND